MSKKSKKESRELAELAAMEELYDRQARRRFAWGQYAATIRQLNLNNDLRKCQTEEERRRLLNDAERQNARGFWVG